MRRRRSHAVAGLTVLLLAACGGTSGEGPDRPAGARLDVVAAFYPLAALAETVGADRVAVTTLAPPGAEPHDLELSPADVREMAQADLVVYLSGFMPAVDDAVGRLPAEQVWDAADHADLDLRDATAEPGPGSAAGAGATDPHFWLDPLRYDAVGRALATALGRLDPTAAASMSVNAQALTRRLAALDDAWRKGTSACASRDLVTSHNAFGYLARRYGLVQRAIAGLTPDSEPTPQALASTTAFVRANGVRTIYYETLVSPAVAETVARETGARTAVLDPIEGITADSPGRDYFAIMAANLTSIREGQPCP